MDKKRFFNVNKNDDKQVKPSDTGISFGFKKQKILIRPVINLPKHSDTVKHVSQAKEVYDPFQPTEEELDEKEDEAYDPFQPTLSDDDRVELPEIEQQEESSVFKKVKTPKLAKPLSQGSLYEFDIDQMLDNQYKASVDTEKIETSTQELLKIKRKPKVSSNFDIFAEEELEKAQAAARTPSEDIFSEENIAINPAENTKRFEKLTHKIKSAFSAENNPSPAESKSISESSQPFANVTKPAAFDSNNDSLEIKNKQQAEQISNDSQALQNPILIMKDHVDVAKQRSLSRSPNRKSSINPSQKELHDLAPKSGSQKTSQSSLKEKHRPRSGSKENDQSESPSPRKTKSHSDKKLRSRSKTPQRIDKKHRRSHSKSGNRSSRSKPNRSSSRTPRNNRHRSRSRTPRKDRHRSRSKTPRKDRHRSQSRTTRKDRHHSRSRTPKKDRKRRRSRSGSRHKSSLGRRERSRSRTPRKSDKKRRKSRSKSRLRSPRVKSDRSQSKSPRKSSKKQKKSRSRSRHKSPSSKSDKKRSNKRSSSQSKHAEHKAHNTSDEENLKNVVLRDQDDKIEKSKKDFKHSEKQGKEGKRSKHKAVKDSLETFKEDERKQFQEKDHKDSKKPQHDGKAHKDSDQMPMIDEGKYSAEASKEFEDDTKINVQKRDHKHSEKKTDKDYDKKLSHDDKKRPKKRDGKDVSEKPQEDDQILSKESSHKKYDKKHSNHEKRSVKDEKESHKLQLVIYSNSEKSTDEDAQKFSKKKKKKKKYEKEEIVEDDFPSKKKKKKHKRYERMSSDSEANLSQDKSHKKEHKIRDQESTSDTDKDRRSTKKKKKRNYSPNDEIQDNNSHQENKTHKQSKKRKHDKALSVTESTQFDIEKVVEHKHSKKKHKHDDDEADYDYIDKHPKKKRKKRTTRVDLDMYADLEEFENMDKKAPAIDAKVVESPEVHDTKSTKHESKAVDPKMTTTSNSLEEDKLEETFSSNIIKHHLSTTDPTKIKHSNFEEGKNNKFSTEKQQESKNAFSKKDIPSDNSQEIDIDYLLEESLNNLPAVEEKINTIDLNRKNSISDQLNQKHNEEIEDQDLRSPSPLSPSLLSPDSSAIEDAVSSQNSSMITSGQEFKETPSYAETFLEQSRKRWEKSYRTKSPHISSTMTPDDGSLSEISKVDTKTDVNEQSMLSDISVDHTAKVITSCSEITTADTSSVSAEDIFAASPVDRSNDQEKSKQQISFESVIKLDASEIMQSTSDQVESPSSNARSSLNQAPQDTDLRVLLQQLNPNRAEVVDVGKTDQPVSLESESGPAKPDKKEAKRDKSSYKSRKRSTSPRRRSPSSHRKYSDRKRSDRHRRSRSRSYERRSRHRRSASRSPRRKYSYESRNRRTSTRDRRRTSEKHKTPERRHYSQDKDSHKSHKPSEPAIPLPKPQEDASLPKIELLNKFLEQTTEFIPLLAQTEIQKTSNAENVVMSPQPIATISGISTANFPHCHVHDATDHIPDGLEHHHEIASSTFQNLVNESRPALIQIPTVDSHSSEVKNNETPEKAEEKSTNLNESDPELYSPSRPMSPFTPEEKDTPPPPPKVTSSSEVSSTTPATAASLFSKLFGLKKDSVSDTVKADLKQEPVKDKEAENVLNPTQILNIAGLNPQQQSAAKDAIMSIAELSKQLQLGQILSHVDKSKQSISQEEKDEDGLSPVNIDNIEGSAVEMYNNDKRIVQEKKKEFQNRVIAAAKSAIKPHYDRREVNKEQYKDIMKRAVNKICQTDRNMEVNDVKIRRLIRRYVECYQQKNEKKKEKMRIALDKKLDKHFKDGSEDADFLDSPPSPETSPLDDLPYSPIDEFDTVSVPTLLKKEPRKIVTLPDLPLPPPPPPPRPKHMM